MTCRLVIAVDPADLDPVIAALPNVAHIRLKVEDAVPTVLAAAGGQLAHLLVCDMNCHPEAACQVCPLRPSPSPPLRHNSEALYWES